MDNLKIETEDLIKLVNQKVSMSHVLKKVYPHNHYTPGRPCFCPFHDNHNTPAAVIYNNDNNETLYCFSEQKLYTPSDLVKQVLSKDVYQLGFALWNQMPEHEQSMFLESIHKYTDVESFSINIGNTDSEKSDNLKQFEHKLDLFKYSKITYTELMQNYLTYLMNK